MAIITVGIVAVVVIVGGSVQASYDFSQKFAYCNFLGNFWVRGPASPHLSSQKSPDYLQVLKNWDNTILKDLPAEPSEHEADFRLDPIRAIALPQSPPL